MVGEIAGVISMQYRLDSAEFEAKEWEVFEKKEEKKEEPKLDEEGNPIEAPPAEAPPAEEGEGEEKKVTFNPADFKWTKTDRCARNIVQLFRDWKGSRAVLEEKSSASFDDVASEAVSKALDDFCARMQADGASKYIY